MIMIPNMKWVLALGAGLVGGWALRSLSDSPEGAGVKLLEIGIKAKERVDLWAAVERERLEDMLAEARSNISRENEATSEHSGLRCIGGQNSAKLFPSEPYKAEPLKGGA
jgi:hypothetical protein